MSDDIFGSANFDWLSPATPKEPGDNPFGPLDFSFLDAPKPADNSDGVFGSLDFDTMLKPLEALKRKPKAKRKPKPKRTIEQIAIFDTETDPFDNVARTEVFPFLGVLYADAIEPVVIWDEDRDRWAAKVIAAIEALPGRYTIYAHNGGKFDFMFLLKHLRGQVSFKGRGIMEAQIGEHTLRDSFHIIPERLANFKKDHIDYENMKKGKREAFKKQIIDYCIADCRYLLEIVRSFVERFGFKISIGQAAMASLKQNYEFENISPYTDKRLRDFFFGGRVECFEGAGEFHGHYYLIDRNSMYPAEMANTKHPIGNEYIWRTGSPDENTAFIDLTCYSKGAFVMRDPEDGSTRAPHGLYRFKTTIHEYKMARKLKLISNIKIHCCIDNNRFSTFEKFVLPFYDQRQEVKKALSRLKSEGKEGTPEWDELKKDDIFLKLILNNAYGKFAQNPRNYKEHYITDPNSVPPEDPYNPWPDFPKVMEDDYWLWERPNPTSRYNNVGTGASITGAARANLMETIHLSKGVIYCDTDSVICTGLPDVDLDKSRLGAWDIEREMSSVVIAGKKLYAYREIDTAKEIVKAKGASGLTYAKLMEILSPTYDFETAPVISVAKGVTISKTGSQMYMTRRIRSTARKEKRPWSQTSHSV